MLVVFPYTVGPRVYWKKPSCRSWVNELGLETPPVAPPTVCATFGAEPKLSAGIFDDSTPENGHFQPPKGAVGVSLKLKAPSAHTTYRW